MSTKATSPEFNIAVACDVRLGEIVRRNPELTQIDVDPEAVAAGLQDMRVPEGPSDGILVIATHDRTVEGLTNHTDIVALAALQRPEYRNFVLVPIGGSKDAFVGPFMMSLALAGPYSHAAEIVEEYAEPRGFHPVDVLSNLPDHLPTLAYLNPTPRSEVEIQHLALGSILKSTELMVAARKRASSNGITLREAFTELGIFYGYLASFFGGVQAGEAVAPHTPVPFFTGIAATIAWRKVDRFLHRHKRVEQVTSQDIERVEHAAHDAKVPPIVRFVLNSQNANI